MNLPRLTGALRAFCNVSSPGASRDEDPNELELKRREISERKTRITSLKSVKEFFYKNSSSTENEIEKQFKELIAYVKEIASTEISSDMLESSAIYLLELFTEYMSPGLEQTKKIQKMFGTVSASLCHTISKLVNSMVISLDESARHALKEIGFSKEVNLMDEEFGQKIKFVGFHRLSERDILISNDSSDKNNRDLKFTLIHQNVEITEESKTVITYMSCEEKRTKYDEQWVLTELMKYYENTISVSVEDVAKSIMHTLHSEKSNDELQNDLFELLGFDRMTLIYDLLKHRKEVISLRTIESIDVPPNKLKSSMNSRPTYGCQVTIQSELEKSIIKQARKEEKRLQRDQSKNFDDGSSSSFAFDPEYLRQQREAQLYAAKQVPLFSCKEASRSKREKLPNVFDSYAEARMSAGFISGRKVMLPKDCKRNENTKYEEVEIPAHKLSSDEFIKPLISVQEMDQIGQDGFRGMKTLNTIQSHVYETAYFTNENMLVCAPTGAGKTNVAMLTILHQIGQHTEDGILRKEKFKIIYIAPMKALAAEMVRNFGNRLAPFGIIVKELTGDMQLTKTEIMQTQMIVTTPEKWDVVTRKSTGDVALTQLVKLIILDEVHLLHGDRGPVLEALVARTLRQVESSQSMIRILGLSATLPNYTDVAAFLKVNCRKGLFYFDGRFRPVPLYQTFIGIKTLNPLNQLQDMDDVCYDKVTSFVEKGHQIMVFVHTRNATLRTATILKDMALNKGHSKRFQPDQNAQYGFAEKQMMRARSKHLQELFPYGFAIHHAGMLRSDRNLVERYFSEGLIKVLVCTSTLAWGVNLPAHAVIIKGTEIYNAKHGSFVDLGVLDVMQIFGRAGRPQYDKVGHGIIITSHNKLSHYLSLLTSQFPIESNFISNLADNLNAEVALGTVTNLEEAVQWLSYTYLYVRMRYNPLCYGIKFQQLQEDHQLAMHREKLLTDAAMELDKAKMIRFDQNTGYMYPTDFGRTASHFYITHDTVEKFNELLHELMSEDEIIAMISEAQEFEQLKVREDELDELEMHYKDTCMLPAKGGPENTIGKVNILMQTHISRGRLDSFSLISDQNYIIQNSTRIIRFLFEVVLRKNWAVMSSRLLTLCKVIEQQQWPHETPLRQFSGLNNIIINKIENLNLDVENMKQMEANELGQMLHHVNIGKIVKDFADQIPQVLIEATIQPITREVLRVNINITPDFKWNDHSHGHGAESFWLWIEDPDDDYIYHFEYFMLLKKQVVKKETQHMVFTIPVAEHLPSQYLLHIVSDRWLGCNMTHPVSFKHLILPEVLPPHTDLLNLQPLPVTALNNSKFESLYKFTHFNPIQTQIFHTLYHTDANVLLGAPTGSGKTIAAELAILRNFIEYPECKAVYIAPLKALVRERILDWKERFERILDKTVVELTGDAMPDVKAIAAADIIVTTPEKWDGVSRSWQTRNYVQAVSVIVIDEIHLLGEDRGPVLEVIVSRTNFISAHTKRNLRIVGLSTALANARDLADWLGIKNLGLFNFRPSVRPVPLEVHVDGYPGKHYCPRMALMNKPTYQAIRTYSPSKPVIIFVSSRRQTRLTALDLISFLAAEDRSRQWIQLPDDELDIILMSIKDQNLKLTLAFGIGIHHAGLHEYDRKIVEQLFLNQKIQILVATATLAWGVNFPAHLVVVKGTEYYDGKLRRYVDYPVTDVLQMMGRAGRPQFDDHGIAVVLVHDIKKNFYKKFLYSPFPVESSLLQVFPDHLNAEIVAGTITSKQDCLDYITWTYFFRRLMQNPTYYGLEAVENNLVNSFLSGLVDRSIAVLEDSFCVEIEEDNRSLKASVLGRIASYYYLSHKTIQMFKEKLQPDSDIEKLLQILCDAEEYAELPVRHNEDAINENLAKDCPLEVKNAFSFDSPHTKAHLLFQAHFSHLYLPCSDYITDLKSVLDQSIRILQAIIDVSADQGWLATCLNSIILLQMVLQARWFNDSTLLTLPHIELSNVYCFCLFCKTEEKLLPTLPEVVFTIKNNYEVLSSELRKELEESQIESVYQTLIHLPIVNVFLSIKEGSNNDVINKSRSILNEPFTAGKQPECQWIKVHSDTEYVLLVEMVRKSKRKQDSKALAPKFPKQKDEGWFLVLGDVENKELVAMKRIPYLSHKNAHQLAFYSPVSSGRVIYTVYLMSDCYLGLDQQFEICLEVQQK